MAETEHNEYDEVEKAKLDEVIVPGDERHGTHNPLPQTRDTLSVHEQPSPAEVFDDPDPSVDRPQDVPIAAPAVTVSPEEVFADAGPEADEVDGGVDVEDE